MSMNGFVAFAAIAVTSMGIIARACKHPGALETQKTSVTPNNSVLNNTVSGFNSKGKSPRDLGIALAA